MVAVNSLEGTTNSNVISNFSGRKMISVSLGVNRIFNVSGRFDSDLKGGKNAIGSANKHEASVKSVIVNAVVVLTSSVMASKDPLISDSNNDFKVLKDVNLNDVAVFFLACRAFWAEANDDSANDSRSNGYNAKDGPPGTF